MSDHLTVIDQKLEHQRRATQPGMAHWAGSGPSLKTCRECDHFDSADGYYAKGGKHGGALKPGLCKKYKSLMQGHAGSRISHNLPACKYFLENEKPPQPVDR